MEIDIARIKGNIQKMLDQGAPETDIDAYVAGEGFTAEQLKSAKAHSPSNGGDGVSGAWGLFDAGIQGIPVVGPLLQKGGAAAAAVAQPYLGIGEDTSFGDRYNENLKTLQGRTQQFAAENPVASTAAGIAGGTVALLPLGATAVGAKALGLSGSMPARMGLGATTGAVLGGGDAVVRGSETEDIGNGAAVGAGVGLFSPIFGRLAGAGIKKATETLAPRAAPLADYTRAAVNKVARAFGDDAIAPDAASRLGPNAMLLDFGPNLRLQGEALATQPGSASKIVGKAVTDRFRGAGDRITSDVDSALGPYQNFRETQKKAISARSAEGNKLYGEAFKDANPVDVTGVVQYVDDVVSPGLSSAINGDGGIKADSIASKLLDVKRFFASNNAQRINPKDLHLVKQDIDDEIDAAMRSGRGKLAGHLIEVRNRLVSSLDDATGGKYSVARSKFRSDSKNIQALEDGQALFKKSTRPDDLVDAVKNMSASEREAFKIGARDAVDEVMGTVKNDALAARTLFGKGWNKQKLEAVVGKPAADRMLGAIERENVFAETYGAVQRGSQTRGRQAAGSEFPNKVSSSSSTLVNPSVLGAGELAFRKVFDALRAGSRSGALESQGADAAKLLTAQSPGREAIIRALGDYQRGRAYGAKNSEAIDRMVTILLQGQNRPAQSLLP